MTPVFRRAARVALLSSSIAACFVPGSAAAHETGGSLLFVTNCDDSGPGSLRDTVASAISGDSIDLAQMGCSTLTLTTGAIVVPQNDLTIKYSNETRRATISASYHSRIFMHTGTGTLEIDHLAITHGKYSPPSGRADGGCIDSPAGRVVLQNSVVSYCLARSSGGTATGGGIAARDVGIYESDVFRNRAQSDELNTYYAAGGGISASVAKIRYSTVTDNEARASYRAFGGGVTLLMITGTSSIDHSLVARNASSQFGGGVHAESYNSASLQLTDTTLYANEAGKFAGGINLHNIASEIRSVTIANNRSLGHFDGYGYAAAPALSMYGDTLILSSSIITNNVSVDVPGDGQLFAFAGGFIGMDHCLVFGPSGIGLPPDTITSDPLLLALTDNGGSSPTMALRAESPAIDQGIASDGLTADQRGPGFARFVGAAVDIGAFERQGPDDGDRIMIGDFDPP